ncbi:MAG: hypothetical protein ACLGHZ_00115 [Actinomycetes bacterium]
MSFVSHAHATLTTAAMASSALPGAPVVADAGPAPRRRHQLLARLVAAWHARAERHENTWEPRWTTAA